jgi:hypothetical protein
VLLSTVERPGPDSLVTVEGFPLLTVHPTILFGDGGSAKSYFGLYVAGRLAQDGRRVLLADWELSAPDHADRLARLFGSTLPPVEYARCDRALVHEVDRLRRIIQSRWIEFVVLDSVAFGCDGPPEAAEVAARYFQALRGLGPVGSLLVAHVNKQEDSSFKPFGSSFWHNGARATWHCSLSEPATGGESTRTLAVINRKANLGRLRDPLAYRVTFDADRTSIERTEVGDSTPDLLGHLTVRQRLALVLRSGAMTLTEAAAAVGAAPETVRKMTYRHGRSFVLLDGGKRIGLRGGSL